MSYTKLMLPAANPSMCFYTHSNNNFAIKNTFSKCHKTSKQIVTGSPLGAANCISYL